MWNFLKEWVPIPTSKNSIQNRNVSFKSKSTVLCKWRSQKILNSKQFQIVLFQIIFNISNLTKRSHQLYLWNIKNSCLTRKINPLKEKGLVIHLPLPRFLELNDVSDFRINNLKRSFQLFCPLKSNILNHEFEWNRNSKSASSTMKGNPKES